MSQASWTTRATTVIATVTTIVGAFVSYYAFSTVAPEPEEAVQETAETETAEPDNGEQAPVTPDTIPNNPEPSVPPWVLATFLGAGVTVIAVAVATLNANKKAKEVAKAKEVE